MDRTVHKRKLFLLENILDYCIEKIFRVIFRNSPMLFQKGSSLLGIPLIEQVKNGVDRTLNHRTVVVLDIAGQITIVSPIVLWILGGNDS